MGNYKCCEAPGQVQGPGKGQGLNSELKIQSQLLKGEVKL